MGLSSGGSSITNTTVFVSQPEFARIHHAVPSYLLVGIEPSADASTVAEGVRQAVPGVTVQTREEFAASEARIVTDMSADLLRLMSTIGLLIAMAVVALGLMTATLNRLQEYAVLKALGATTGRLAGAVTVQVLWTVTLAALVASTLALALSWAVPLLSPAVTISITAAAVLRTTVGTLAVGLLAAAWPLHRIGVLDAATAFRETR
ncbi:ABC transporter permease [uncultured Serinicoccus sp.]|uniref:ABC transporter permease n=1 Tax=uncultured Serinicoccus sp. TaxID=735514 RepID=UPI00261B4E1A|nr:ABC transporter permease [uncultured Serinicoccus sp.]